MSFLKGIVGDSFAYPFAMGLFFSFSLSLLAYAVQYFFVVFIFPRDLFFLLFSAFWYSLSVVSVIYLEILLSAGFFSIKFFFAVRIWSLSVLYDFYFFLVCLGILKLNSLRPLFSIFGKFPAGKWLQSYSFSIFRLAVFQFE